MNTKRLSMNDCMNITAYGGRKVQRDIVIRFANWLSVELVGPRLAKNISIDIILQKFPEEGYLFRGFQYNDGCHLRPRSFVIELEKMQDDNDLLETLAHEMVHVKQEVLGEVKERYRGGKHRILWMGEDHTNTPYRKQPWEREAFKLEKRLVKKYIKATS